MSVFYAMTYHEVKNVWDNGYIALSYVKMRNYNTIFLSVQGDSGNILDKLIESIFWVSENRELG